MRKSVLCATLTVLLTVAELAPAQVSAAHNKPLWEPPNIEWPTTGSGDLVLHRLSLAGIPIRLDHTKREYVRKKLGGVAASKRDAGDWEGWICYQGTDQSGRWVFWLTSDEINGDAIGGFVWKRVEPQESVDSRCKSIASPNSIKLQFPLSLGMKEAGAARVLGKPTSEQDSERFYLHSRQETTKADRYTTENAVEIKTRSGIVIQIAAFETSSD